MLPMYSWLTIRQELVDESDPYADYPIPDDLMW